MSLENDQVDFTSPIENFTNAMRSLRDFIALVHPVLHVEDKRVSDSHATALIPLRFAISDSAPGSDQALSEEQKEALRLEFNSPFEVSKAEDGSWTMNVPGEAGRRFERALSEVSKVRAHKTLFYRNCLTTLTSNAEWFLAEILRGFFESHPEAAGIKEKSLTLDDLRELGTISDAEQYLLNLRIDEVMRGGFYDWLKYFRSQLKLQLSWMSSSEARLNEVFQRRNSIVHNNGVAHRSYISKVDSSLRKGIEQGQPLTVNRRYIHNAIDIIETNFLLVAGEVWKKLRPKDEERASVFNKITINALDANRHSMALGCSRFQTEDSKLPEKWVLYGKLNYWQTMKWSGEFAKIEAEVREEDLSAKEDLVKLARHVLLDEFDLAFEVTQTVLNAKKLDTDSLSKWPIFREFRKDARVASLIEAGRATGSATVNLTADDVREAKQGESGSV